MRGLGGDRVDIWSEWQQITNALRRVVGGVAAAWVSGSFISDKPNPADIDCLYVVDTARLAVAVQDPRNAGLMDVIARSGVKATFGLRVDSYVLEWMPFPGASPPVGTEVYLRTRGYWDDLRGRTRDSDDRLASIPRRGYLEVILDGYN